MRSEKITDRYRRVRIIGTGAFGDVYLGIDTVTNEDVAIKVQKSGAKPPVLHHEANVYRLLSNGLGFVNCRCYGTVGAESVLVLDLLGPSLEESYRYCGRMFSMKTLLMIAGNLIFDLLC